MLDLVVIFVVVIVGVVLVLGSQQKRVHPDPLQFVDMQRETLHEIDEHDSFDNYRDYNYCMVCATRLCTRSVVDDGGETQLSPQTPTVPDAIAMVPLAMSLLDSKI